MTRVCLIFLKYPTPGRVKTRLAADLGAEGAAHAFRKMVAKVFEQCRRANPEVIAVCYDPPGQEEDVKKWLSPLLAAFPGKIEWIAQSDGDLGDRLEKGTAAVFEKYPESKVAVMGTDCVEIGTDIFKEVWSKIGEASDVVYGPTEDGGYYLVAMNQLQPALFRDIAWSSEETLSESLQAAAAAGLSTHLLPARTDIDTIEEWRPFDGKLSNRPCVFYDRDGVINRSPGPGYVLGWEDFYLNDGIAESLRIAKERGYLAIIITSQRGVGKGLMSQGELDRIHRNLQKELSETGVGFDGIYAYTETDDCPHKAKPDPEMILSAAGDFFIEATGSWMIGDADRDIEMGIRAGLKGTIRIVGDKAVGNEAEFTLNQITELPDLFKKIL